MSQAQQSIVPQQVSFLPAALAMEFGPLREYFDDPLVTEIMVNPDGCVWVERSGVISERTLVLEESARTVILKRVANLNKQDCVSGQPSAILNSVVEGMRISGGLKPLSPDGSFFSLRKHLPPELRPTLATLIDWEACTQQQADLLVELIVHKKLNCLVVGSTSSGKTTFTNAILGMLPAHERVICIEDSSELHIKVKNKLCLKTNEQQGLSTRMLVKLAMRQRPDRLIVGELRHEEVFDFVRAMNSGHDGSLSTIHASSAAMGLEALEMLFQMSLPPGASITSAVAQKYIASGVQMLVFVARRYVEQPDGSQKSIRRVEDICLVKGVRNGEYVLEKL